MYLHVCIGLSLRVFCVLLYVLLCLCYLELVIDHPFDYQTPMSVRPGLV